MRTYLRAGLFVLILTLLAALTTAAPVHPNRASAISSSGSIEHAAPSTFRQQTTFNSIDDKNQHSIVSSDGVAARETITLYRRMSIFNKIKRGFQKLGKGIKHVAQKIGHGIKAAAQKVGHGIKVAAQKVGHGIKVAAKKVGHFVKTTGAKIAKVGLKIWSTVQKVASKVVGFIPVIGKPLSRAMSGAAAITNKISDSIHAKIGGKLGKAMNGMSKTQKIVGYIPRELSDLEERGIGELDERDLYAVNMALEAKEMLGEWAYERSWDDFEDSYIY